MTFLHFVFSLLSNVSAFPSIFPSFYPLLEDKMSPNLIALYHLTSMAPLSWMTLPHPFLHDHMPSCPGWLHALDDCIPLCPEWPHTTLSWMTTYHPVLNDLTPPYPGWPHTTLSWMIRHHPVLYDFILDFDSWPWLFLLFFLLAGLPLHSP